MGNCWMKLSLRRYWANLRANKQRIQGVPFRHWLDNTRYPLGWKVLQPKGYLDSFHFLQFLIVPLRMKGHGHEVLAAGRAPLSR